MDSVFIKINDQETGSVSLAELQNLIHEGSFTSEDLVWAETEDDWRPASEIETLKGLFHHAPKRQTPCKIWAVAGGKGGVGKTVISTSLGIGLATLGNQITLVDADFAGANLHTVLGVTEPKLTFFDFYTLQKDSLNDIMLDTAVENLNFISGACGTLGIANQRYFQKLRFVRELKKLDSDLAILDLGAGSSFNVIDFFLIADEKIVVTTPEPTAIHEAFGFIKVGLMRELSRRLKKHETALAILQDKDVNKPGKMQLTMADILQKLAEVDEEAYRTAQAVLADFSPKLILNMVRHKDDLIEGQAIQAAALELLGIQVQYLGYVSDDPVVRESIREMRPLLIHKPGSKAAQDISALIRVKILGKRGVRDILERRKWRKHLENYGKSYPEADRFADVPICSMKCFYWGDCDYQDGGKPCRVRHLEPSVHDLQFNDTY
jgi:flagellar biosynthesis protein FlhG